MSHGPANTVWARCFADELARAGVREVVLAPGSRSTPLVLAFARDGRFRLRVHLDERSAGFFALGTAKATGIPAALVTTSGTAAANVLPAVVEAWASETPLLVLTADRPPRLRRSDANQTIDQVHLYGGYTREFFDASLPVLGGPELRHLRALACRAVAAARGAPAGPVHVNFPFDKPLEPTDELPGGFAREHALALGGRPDGAPFVEVAGGRLMAGPAEFEPLAEALASATGVIVAGPSPEPARLGPAVLALAERTGFPVLADPLSGARFGRAGGAHVVSAYDLFLRDEHVVDALAPGVVLRVGTSPTSAALLEWLLRHDGVPHVVVDGGSRWKDHGATATGYVRADAASTLLSLAERVGRTASDEWRGRWKRAECAALGATGQGGETHEGVVWPAVLEVVPADGTLFVSSSMPVRDLDAFGHARAEPMLVLGNRGASGIDGVVSTAFGAASQREGVTVCVIGDLALFHDQNGLLWAREDDAHVVFVLVDNDGGGIFHALPVAEHEPHFTPYFATPHGLDLAHAARLHGLELRDVTTADLGRALQMAVAAGRTTMLRVRTERAANVRRRREIVAAAARAAREALS